MNEIYCPDCCGLCKAHKEELVRITVEQERRRILREMAKIIIHGPMDSEEVALFTKITRIVNTRASGEKEARR